jgi:hypothetical protein
MKFKVTKKQAWIYGSAIVIAVIALSLALAYLTPLRDPVTVFFKRIYPVALVESNIISVNDLEQAGLAGQKLGVGRQQAEDNFIDAEKSYALAKRLNLSINSYATADELRFYTKGNESEYNNLIKNVFGSEHFFRKYVINPQVVDAQLRMKYYSDVKGASPAYKRAQAVIDRLAKGEKFEDLARSESDDKATGQIGGDLGFYESGQVLPELEDMISISPTGEFRRDIVISRLGYHVIYPVEYSTINGKKMWHAKHMLFVPEGYEQWLAQQTRGISVKYLKN